MNLDPKNITIGALAEVAGVHVESIRFYQRKGLIPKPERPLRGIRRYGQAELVRLHFIKSAQRLGFSLDEIAELLMLEDGTQCTKARGIAQHKLQDVRAKLADLRCIESTLDKLVERCDSARGSVKCPLVLSLLDVDKKTD